jgi:hypothetical protein
MTMESGARLFHETRELVSTHRDRMRKAHIPSYKRSESVFLWNKCQAVWKGQHGTMGT